MKSGSHLTTKAPPVASNLGRSERLRRDSNHRRCPGSFLSQRYERALMKFRCRTTEAIQDGGGTRPACLFPKLFLRAPLSSMATRSEKANVIQYGTFTSCHKSLSALFFMILCETITGLFWFPHISLRVMSHLNLNREEVRKRQWKDNLYSITVRTEKEKLTFKSSQHASHSKEGL
ncbi:hypothetical protein DPX16_8077 [Anabarilius grahami]|uniref:Transmembrane protein n=1 Tax=Anabarilius grahami TaxID=495550 RepID=A0A3N0XYA1_ANAGA|nr:hypothetical protein DPX16_8077 [Anabarilius grahami]